MEDPNGAGGFAGLIPLFLMTIPIAIFCYKIAKEKGQSVRAWTILGIIPIIGMFAFTYLVGAKDLYLEEKVDKILSILEKHKK